MWRVRKVYEGLRLLKRISKVLRNLVIPISFALSISMLYILDPSLFEVTWKGRAPHLIFLWLLLLELALAWEKLREKQSLASSWSNRVIIVVMAAAPIVYVVIVYFFGVNYNIIKLGQSIGIPFGRLPPGIDREWFPQVSWPLSLEYIFFTAFFAASLLVTYGWFGPKRFPISLFFLGATGIFYLIDTFYPYGTFTFLQALAPATASSTVQILNWMGYEAYISRFYEGMPVLYVAGLRGPSPAIAWGCAGIQSLFIYTFTILLFLKDRAFSLTRKIIYVTIGGIGTFIINVLRIVSYCVIGVNTGQLAADIFHKYYGELYFIAWIIVYILVITYGGQVLTKMSVLVSKLKEPLVSYRRTNQ